MCEEITIRIADLIGGSLCISTDDGQKVHDKIAPLLREGRNVVLSFEKIETIISPFLNASIGQLYGELSEEAISNHLNVRNMIPEDKDLLERVIENAKRYFRNKVEYDQAWKEELGDEE